MVAGCGGWKDARRGVPWRPLLAGAVGGIAAGQPPSETERFDIAFAEAAIRIQGDQRQGKRVQVQRRCVHCAIVAGAVVVALNVLLCLGLAFFMLAAHTSPF